MPDGSSQDVSVADSGLATLKAKDGTQYDVSATVQDEPFTTVTIRFFTPPSTNDPGSLIGEVQAKKGAGPVATKTTPSFKVAVKAIELKGKSS